MKVIIYDIFYKLNNCKKIIGIYKDINRINNNDGAFIFVKNGKAHNETSYAYYHPEVFIKQFFYKNMSYNSTNNKSWTKFVKHLKRQNKLKIFL